MEHNEDAQQLVGYHGDKRQQKAEIILRRSEVNKHSGGSSNDIGFKRDANGCFSAIISDYDKHKHNDKWLADLKKSYADKKIRKQAKTAGLTLVKRIEGKDGSFKLQFVKA